MAKTYIKVNELGRRIGESHARAKLSDFEIQLLLTLIDAREQCIHLGRLEGLKQQEINKMLAETELSFRCLAVRFGIHKQHVAKVAKGARRCQRADRVKTVPTP